MTLQKVREGILKAWMDSYLDLRDQLAAARERSKELREDLDHYGEVIDKREQQLAAEREKTNRWRDNYAALHKELIEERRLHDERVPANEMTPDEELSELKMRQSARDES